MVITVGSQLVTLPFKSVALKVRLADLLALIRVATTDTTLAAGLTIFVVSVVMVDPPGGVTRTLKFEISVIWICLIPDASVTVNVTFVGGPF
jgi:hypothetical protein